MSVSLFVGGSVIAGARRDAAAVGEGRISVDGRAEEQADHRKRPQADQEDAAIHQIFPQFELPLSSSSSSSSSSPESNMAARPVAPVSLSAWRARSKERCRLKMKMSGASSRMAARMKLEMNTWPPPISSE